MKYVFFVLSGEFLVSAKNPICVVGQGNILNFPDLLTSSQTNYDIQCTSKLGGSMLLVDATDFLHRVNYCFNQPTLHYLLKNISSKQRDTYSLHQQPDAIKP